MPEPELNDLLKLLEKKYQKKDGDDAAAGARPGSLPRPTSASAASGLPSEPLPPGPAASARPPTPPASSRPTPPASGAIPTPTSASIPAPSTPPARPQPAASGPPPGGAPQSSPQTPPPAAGTSAPAAASPPSGPPAASPDAGAPAPPASSGIITSISVPRRGGMSSAGGGRRPPPPSGFVGAGGGVPSRFGAPPPSGAPTGFGGGTPSSFGGGTPSAFGGGTPSSFGGGGTASAFGAPSAFGGGTPSTFGGAAAAPVEAAAAAAPTPAAPVRNSDEPNEAHYGLVVKPIPRPLNAALRQVESTSIIRAIRPTLGRETSQWMFRAAYFIGLLQAHGKDFHPWSLLAGRKFGQLVQIPNYESVDKALRQLKMGRVLYQEDAAAVTFDVQECLICDGMMGLNEPCCGFVGGLLGSVVGRVTGRDVVVKETKCIGTNHEICRFEVSFSRGVVND